VEYVTYVKYKIMCYSQSLGVQSYNSLGSVGRKMNKVKDVYFKIQFEIYPGQVRTF
jgi:hypothetical protein